jgi:hypothetical protein
MLSLAVERETGDVCGTGFLGLLCVVLMLYAYSIGIPCSLPTPHGDSVIGGGSPGGGGFSRGGGSGIGGSSGGRGFAFGGRT